MAVARRGTASGYGPVSSGTTITVTKPTGTVAGDYIYLWAINYNSSSTTATASGFTLLTNFNYLAGDPINGCLFRRVATGSEGGTTVDVVWDSSNYLDAGIITFSGVDSEVLGTGVGSAGTPTAVTGVTTTVDDAIILSFLTGYNNGFSSPSGNEIDNYDGGGVACYSETKTTAGATGTLAVTHATGDSYIGIRIALQPSASSPVSVNLTKQDMTVTNRAPTVDVGSSPTNVNLTKPTYTTTHRPPTVSIAATVNLTLATFTVTNRAISVQVSSTVNLTRQVMTVTNRAPLVSYGASVNLARQIMSVTNRAPAIPLYLSRQILTITNRAVGFSIGATINLARQIITVTNRFVSVFIPGTGTPESQQRTRKRRRQ
ncbi:hypothetical protein [Caudoviricetes sp.]|nr:hypothetical protein [Caudoviricetes sp.]